MLSVSVRGYRPSYNMEDRHCSLHTKHRLLIGIGTREPEVIRSWGTRGSVLCDAMKASALIISLAPLASQNVYSANLLAYYLPMVLAP